MRSMLGLLTEIILKKVGCFKAINLIACKAKDGKEVAKSLMRYNLLKIIHLFPGKKHLRA